MTLSLTAWALLAWLDEDNRVTSHDSEVQEVWHATSLPSLTLASFKSVSIAYGYNGYMWLFRSVTVKAAVKLFVACHSSALLFFMKASTPSGNKGRQLTVSAGLRRLRSLYLMACGCPLEASPAFEFLANRLSSLKLSCLHPSQMVRALDGGPMRCLTTKLHKLHVVSLSFCTLLHFTVQKSCCSRCQKISNKQQSMCNLWDQSIWYVEQLFDCRRNLGRV